jgi:peptide/nickel transport system substrate-binding protein
MHATRIRTRLVLAAAASLLVVAGCSSSSAKHPKLATNGTFTLAVDSDPGNLNPLAAVKDTTNAVDAFAYDGLVTLDSHGKVVGELAQSWTVTPTKAVFTLRKGITCSDGAALTAHDVANNFTWIKDPKHASPLLGSSVPAQYSVQADDAANTVTLTVPQPYGFLLEGAGQVPIVCAKGLSNLKLLANGTDGTGPFDLTQNVPSDHVTLTVRKDYKWGPNGATSAVAGFPGKIVVRVIQNVATQVNEFLSGQLNEVTPTSSDQARMKGQTFATITSLSGPSDLFFNERPGYPGADPAVRKALTMALDRATLAKVQTQNHGSPATTLTVIEPHPCGLPNSTAGSLPGFDLSAAASELDQAGWTVGSGGIRAKNGKQLTMRMAYASDAGAADNATIELASQEWKKLGVKVQLAGQSNNAFLQTLFSGGKWDAGYVGIKLIYPNTFVPFASGKTSESGGQNFADIANADYQRLSSQALATPANQGGCPLWAQAEQALFAGSDVVPLGVETVTTYTRGATILGGDIRPTTIRMLA